MRRDGCSSRRVLSRVIVRALTSDVPLPQNDLGYVDLADSAGMDPLVDLLRRDPRYKYQV